MFSNLVFLSSIKGDSCVNKGKIHLLFLDVDGTLTDGKIYMGTDGEIAKAFHVQDGYGIAKLLPEHGIVPVILTSRSSEIVTRRCRELGISLIEQNCQDKKAEMLRIAADYGLMPDAQGVLPKTAYMGDDLPDLLCIRIAAFSACPADAVVNVQREVSYVTKRRGGRGAVREFIEWLVLDNDG